MKFVRFNLDVGGNVEIPEIAAPRSSFDSVHEAVALTVDWEKEVKSV